MNLRHLLKAIFVSIAEAFRRTPKNLSFSAAPSAARRPAPKPLPLWLKAGGAGLLLAGAAAFGVFQFQRNFAERPPAWLKIQTRLSPELPSAAFRRLREECAREAARLRRPLHSVRVLALSDTNGAAWLWNTETLTNPGFAPLAKISRELRNSRDAWVGYYRLDGSPMRCTQRINLTQTNSALLLLHLDAPLAPSATQIVARVTRTNLRLRPNRAGHLQVSLGRFPPSAGVQGAAVVLPPNYRCVRATPGNAEKPIESGLSWVYWLNTRVETNAPPMSVEFKRE
ncbi:MAG: hypothetical protein IT578_03865 [Verrucomicrobiae bacterium]|nr:hypothetical protein [Verrucomicrobiae bacterium]